ncbi:hypothetical protein [Gordonia sp. WA4-43]|uniref:hypothetical protein n=1 Tax=Gordonia sp. WA4-43 TaxID=2878678 RepID=UPI001CFB972F|nr:hypothetical protein [Gordonia sp. WA4-43]UCZ89040.1 hypothetical protein LEL84_18575 [Gordonia sp. WA4-43]
MTERPRVEIIEQAIRSHSANDWLNLTGPIDLVPGLARAIDCGIDAAESEGQAAKTPLPEPDATNPDHVSFAAEIVGKTHPKAGYRAELNDIARRLDSEQAAEREREQRIEQAARAILDFENSQFDHQAGVIPDIAPIDYARALDAAGLLRGGGRGE